MALSIPEPQVGPYVNPSETYNYYDLPFCQHADMEEPHQSLGQVLKGCVNRASRSRLPTYD